MEIGLCQGKETLLLLATKTVGINSNVQRIVVWIAAA